MLLFSRILPGITLGFTLVCSHWYERQGLGEQSIRGRGRAQGCSLVVVVLYLIIITDDAN
jgi:hypothetical protein